MNVGIRVAWSSDADCDEFFFGEPLDEELDMALEKAKTLVLKHAIDDIGSGVQILLLEAESSD